MRNTDRKIVVPFGDVVRNWMRYARVSTGEMADRLGMSRVSVSLIINGRMRDGERQLYDPSASMIVQFANIAEVDPAVIIQVMTGDLPLTSNVWRQSMIESVLDALEKEHAGDDKFSREEMRKILYKIDSEYE